MSSINFNSSAEVALATLRDINTRLDTLNDQISTGKKVNNARDNAAIYSIATTISADVSSFEKVSESLSLANSAIGVARNASETIVSLLEDAQALVVDAQGKSGDDLATIQTDLDNIKTTISDIVSSASFKGINLVDADGDATTSFLSSLNRSDSGVTSSKIDVNSKDLSLTSVDISGASVVAEDDYKGALASSTFGSDVLTADDALTDGSSDVITFAGEIIDTGEIFDVSFTDGDSNAITAQYVAREGDTSNDVVLGLQKALINALEDAGISSDDIDVSVQTSSRPSDNNVTLTITNNSGSTFGAATAYQERTGGVAGGLLAELVDLDVTSDASAALNDIDDLLEQAISAAAYFGSAQKRIDTQSEFIVSLISSLEAGVSALTDADLEKASAELSALQAQQQLGIASLSIANQAPQAILALFG